MTGQKLNEAVNQTRIDFGIILTYRYRFFFNEMYIAKIESIRMCLSTHYLQLIDYFNGNLYIFPLISLKDIFSISGLTLILKFISRCPCDVKHILFLIKTITSVLNSWTYMYIIISITAHPIRLAVILTIMSISTVIAAVILQYSQRHTFVP